MLIPERFVPQAIGPWAVLVLPYKAIQGRERLNSRHILKIGLGAEYNVPII